MTVGAEEADKKGVITRASRRREPAPGSCRWRAGVLWVRFRPQVW